MKKNYTSRLLYWFVELIRMAAPPLIFSFPFFTVIFATFLDAIDAEFASKKVLSKRQYQEIDKTVDMWWYFWVLGYSYFYLKSFFILLLTLFIYRFVGWVLFSKSYKRKLLIFFPNFFENAFFLFFFAGYFGWAWIISGQMLYISISIVLILKLLQEYWLHVLEKSIWEDVFKLPGRNWLSDKS